MSKNYNCQITLLHLKTVQFQQMTQLDDLYKGLYCSGTDDLLSLYYY